MPASSDDHIISVIRTNKQKAMEIAFDRYWELLLRHTFRKLQSEDLAKDIVQESFIVMWQNIDQLTSDQELLPYLYGVVRNKILIQFRKDEVRLRYVLQHSGNTEKLEPSSHQILLNKELQSIVSDEVDKMPAKMREIYVLKKEENYSIKEIAQRLKISEQTVKNQLLNASGRLKLRLNNYDQTLITIGLIISGFYLLK